MSVQSSKLVSGVGLQPEPKITTGDMAVVLAEQELKAKYKIEVIFSKHRSSRLEKPSPLMLLIWESGKKYHGGGDQKMYWCGYTDCGKPISSDNFGYMHVVCPNCRKEMFLDPIAKAEHIKGASSGGHNIDGLKRMPLVVGEKLANLPPPKLAELLEKTWRQLNGDSDIYLKYSPYEIRYDPREEGGHRLSEKLDRVRVQRSPLIYTLKNIMKDIHAGADLRKRFLAMITS